jgi:predicted metal-dependent peptidase
MKSHKFTEVALTSAQQRAADIANVAFMQECPFYAQLSYNLARYVFTNQVPRLATDGRHIFVNPAYFTPLKTGEQIAAFAHEMSHLVGRHVQRFKHYRQTGEIKGLPVDQDLANRAADYVVNAEIVETIPKASLNPDWLYDPAIKGDELWEDVYVRLFKQKQQDEREGASASPPKLRRNAPGALKGQQGDPSAAANGGSFDDHLEPPMDPATGAEDLPDESEFQEAVARAYATAKAMGKMPAELERRIKELLEPQVDWREHIRMLVTGKIGARHSTWARPSRRRLVLNPVVIMPGKTGYGADCVVVAIDTSGSISERELDAFLAEVGGVLNDCKPRKVIVLGCDARVTQVDELASLDEFEGLREKGVKGGGGTDFRPVFSKVSEEDWRPETLIYCTDMCGVFPDEAPAYPTIWAATTDAQAPWGEVVRLKV